MGAYVIRLPDVGEGVAEAELIEWHVAVGDIVREDDVLAVVMTDKANIEVPSSVEGTITWLAGEAGDTIAVGSDLVRLEVAGKGNTADPAPKANPVKAAKREPGPAAPIATALATPKDQPEPPPKPAARSPSGKPLAAPSVRRRARDAGIDLRHIKGTGPAGRITHEDLDAHGDAGSLGERPTRLKRDTSVNEIKVIGLRRRMAERMAIANAKIPHITIVEEVDVDNLEDLRAELNANYENVRPKLTLLPFVMKAIVEAVSLQPEMNAHFDDDAGMISQYGGVHIGIATQTPNGLVRTCRPPRRSQFALGQRLRDRTTRCRCTRWQPAA